MKRVLEDFKFIKNPPIAYDISQSKPAWIYQDFKVHRFFSFDNCQKKIMKSLEFDGNEFFLLVHPNGKTEADKGFLSAYILHSNESERSKDNMDFEWRIGVVNKLNPKYTYENLTQKFYGH